MDMAEKRKTDQVEITLAADTAGPERLERRSWREAGIADHFVQFYRDDAFLVDEIAGFIAAGLRTVEGGIVIATEAHRRALELRLELSGVDVPSAIARGQYVPLDAEETLARFMINGRPDEVLFTHVVGAQFTRMASAGLRVRAFGEMVAPLWACGNREAAIQLEQLWNKLGRTRRFSLFCAYPMSLFADGKDRAGFRHVCATHAAVIPVEADAGELGPMVPA